MRALSYNEFKCLPTPAHLWSSFLELLSFQLFPPVSPDPSYVVTMLSRALLLWAPVGLSLDSFCYLEISPGLFHCLSPFPYTYFCYFPLLFPKASGLRDLCSPPVFLRPTAETLLHLFKCSSLICPLMPVKERQALDSFWHLEIKPLV